MRKNLPSRLKTKNYRATKTYSLTNKKLLLYRCTINIRILWIYHIQKNIYRRYEGLPKIQKSYMKIIKKHSNILEHEFDTPNTLHMIELIMWILCILNWLPVIIFHSATDTLKVAHNMRNIIAVRRERSNEEDSDY